MTDRYAVIGNPIAHSRSPEIHAAFARETAQDLTLRAAARSPRRLRRRRRPGSRARAAAALNVTVPFKLEAFALATERSAARRACGRLQHAGLARHALVRRQHRWRGSRARPDGEPRGGTRRARRPRPGRGWRGARHPRAAARPQHPGGWQLPIAPRRGPRSLRDCSRTKGRSSRAPAASSGAQHFDVVHQRDQRQPRRCRCGDRADRRPGRSTIIARGRSPTISCTRSEPTAFSAGRAGMAPRVSSTASAC